MNSNARTKFTDHLVQIGPAVLAVALTVWAFLYTGRHEANHSYPELHLKKIANQGIQLKRSMENFLGAGVPLRLLAGVPILTDSHLESDPEIDRILVLDMKGEVIFSDSGEKRAALVDPAAREVLAFKPEAMIESRDIADFSLAQDEANYRVTIPLTNKFEQVGNLVLTAPKSRILADVQTAFNNMTMACLVIVVLFGLVMFWVRGIRGNKSEWYLLPVYLLALVLSSLVINWGLIDLYRHGIEANTKAIAQSFADRIDNALALGLDTDDFSGLEEEFKKVAAASDDISFIRYIVDGQVVIDAGRDLPDEAAGSKDHHQQVTELVHSDGGKAGAITVGVPPDLVSSRFWEIIYGYFWPFLAAILLSCLLLYLIDHYLIVGFRTLKVPATFVLSLSFVLLYYVGLGEAYRSYPKLELEKQAAQGESIRLAMEGFLKAGVPLIQFVGFDTLTRAILDADPWLQKVEVFDLNGQPLYFNGQLDKGSDRAAGIEALSDETNATEIDIQKAGDFGYQFSESQGHYRVSLPLNNKFEQVGTLVLTIPTHLISARIDSGFNRLALWMIALIVLFVGQLFVGDRLFAAKQTRYLNFSYGITFLIAAGLVVGLLVSLYSGGIQAKTKAMSISLGKRLEEATALGLPLTAFAGIDQTFEDYKQRNPELNAVVLVEEGLIRIHTDAAEIGETWQADARFFEYNTGLADADNQQGDTYQISVSIPKKLIYARLWRSIKNFLVLFVATWLLASLFLALVSSLNEQKAMASADDEVDASRQSAIDLVLIKILYFGVVFVEGLFASFLPLYLQELSAANQMDAGSASLLFTAYFAAFAISLIPSGNYADKRGVKLLMLGGILFTAMSAYSMTLFTDFYLIMALRVLAGIGQGMIFIGVQSFILQVTAKGQTTQGTSIIVYGYNTGMISGTAIGALLVIYMGSTLVFKIGAFIGLFIMAFILFLIPDISRQEKTGVQPDRWRAFIDYLKKLAVLFKDLQFINTILFIGLATKATLTGVIVYALPLIMARLDYPQDDIGQVLMFYAAGVLFTNFYIPKLADRLGNTAKILFWGSLGSGFGLILTGLIDITLITGANIPFLRTGMLICGVFILGISHGFIHAPIVTHIAFTKAAGVLGKATTTSIYRFLERIGHVMGPIVIGYLLVLNQYRALALCYVGGALALFGLLFFALRLVTMDSDNKKTGSSQCT